MKKTLLIFPPVWRPDFPYMSTATLKGYLEAKGYEAKQMDLNACTFDFMLREAYLLESLARIEKRLSGPGARALSDGEISDFKKALLIGDYVLENLRPSLAVMRNKDDVYSPVEYGMALRNIYAALTIVSLSYHPTSLGLDKFTTSYFWQSSRQVMEATRDEEVNPFIAIFRDEMVPRILRESPDIVGISIAAIDQIIPSFTLARLLKEVRPDIHIVVGGSVPTRLKDTFHTLTRLFEVIDSCILYEGEFPLLRLVEDLSAGNTLEKVPSLIYKHGNKIQTTPVGMQLPVDSIPFPNYDDLPFELYLCPKLILPMLSTRGCYWDVCTFCDHTFGYQSRTRDRSPKLIVDEMESIVNKYNIRHFAFADECTSPKMGRRMSEEILRRGLEVYWNTDIRSEKTYDEELTRLMAKAGCRMVFTGIESGNQRILDLMDKGTKPEQTERVLRNFTNAGVWTHGFFIFNFPTETFEEAMDTIRFIDRNQDILHSFGSATFLMDRHARVRRNYKDFGVLEVYDKQQCGDMELFFEYKIDVGMTGQELEAIEALEEKLRENHVNRYALTWFSRNETFLFTCRYGIDWHKKFFPPARESAAAESGLLRSDRSWDNLQLVLNRGVFLDLPPDAFTSNGHGGNGAAAEHPGHKLIYSLYNDKIVKLSPDAMRLLLELCCRDGENLEVKVLGLAQQYGCSPQLIREKCRSFIRDICQKEIAQLVPLDANGLGEGESTRMLEVPNPTPPARGMSLRGSAC